MCVFCLAVHYKLHHPAEEHATNTIRNYLLKCSSFLLTVLFPFTTWLNLALPLYFFFLFSPARHSSPSLPAQKFAVAEFYLWQFALCIVAQSKQTPAAKQAHLCASMPTPVLFRRQWQQHMPPPTGKIHHPSNIQEIGEGAEEIGSQMRSAVQKLTLAWN